MPLTRAGVIAAVVIFSVGNAAGEANALSGSADLMVYGAAGSHKLCVALVSKDLAADGNPDMVFYSQGASPLGRPGVGLVATRNVPAVLPSTIDLA